MSSDNNTFAKGVLFGITAAIIWAMFPVVTRLSIDHSLSTWDIIALRFIVTGPILLPVLIRYGFKDISPLAIALLVCGAGAPYLILVVMGLGYTPASHFGVIVPSCMLVFAAIGSWYILKENISPIRIFGIIFIIAGIVTISWEGLNSPGENIWLGDVMFIIGGLLWAGYTIASRYWKIKPMHAVSIVSVVSAIFYLPPYFMFLQPRIFDAPLTEVLLQAFFQGVLAVLVALLFYTRAVEILGASKGSVFAALVPGLALMFAYPVLNEVPSLLQLAGVFVVSFGMILALGLIKKPIS